MRDSLGVSEQTYQTLLDRCGLKGIFNYLNTYGEHMLSLYYYIDEKGSFMKPKRLSDHIAKAIFDALEPKEKMKILEYESYIEDLDNAASD